MLKVTGVKFKKVFNTDMYFFLEKGLRGGISFLIKDMIEQITNT